MKNKKKSGSRYKPVTIHDMRDRLHSGRYASFKNFLAGIKQTHLPKDQQDVLIKDGELFFSGKQPKKKKKKNDYNVSILSRNAAMTPWAVVFYRIVRDEKSKKMILDFLRAALDAEQTLPEIVSSLEQV